LELYWELDELIGEEVFVSDENGPDCTLGKIDFLGIEDSMLGRLRFIDQVITSFVLRLPALAKVFCGCVEGISERQAVTLELVELWLRMLLVCMFLMRGATVYEAFKMVEMGVEPDDEKVDEYIKAMDTRDGEQRAELDRMIRGYMAGVDDLRRRVREASDVPGSATLREAMSKVGGEEPN
jgi:phage shock protein PspC (stress-responsive transcriptional regulator)